MNENQPRLRLVTRVLHLVWAIPGIVASVIFATATGGHPPGIIFLPVVLIVWAAGHLSIWGASRLAQRASLHRGSDRRWPASIVVAVVACGIVAFAGLFLVVAGLIRGEGPASRVEFALLMLAWIAHTTAFFGLLMRQPLGRFIAALSAVGWITTLLVQITDHLVHSRPIDTLEMAIVVVLLAGLGLLAFRLAVGRSEREYTNALQDDR